MVTHEVEEATRTAQGEGATKEGVGIVEEEGVDMVGTEEEEEDTLVEEEAATREEEEVS